MRHYTNDRRKYTGYKDRADLFFSTGHQFERNTKGSTMRSVLNSGTWATQSYPSVIRPGQVARRDPRALALSPSPPASPLLAASQQLPSIHQIQDLLDLELEGEDQGQGQQPANEPVEEAGGVGAEGNAEIGGADAAHGEDKVAALGEAQPRVNEAITYLKDFAKANDTNLCYVEACVRGAKSGTLGVGTRVEIVRMPGEGGFVMRRLVNLDPDADDAYFATPKATAPAAVEVVIDAGDADEEEEAEGVERPKPKRGVVDTTGWTEREIALHKEIQSLKNVLRVAKGRATKAANKTNMLQGVLEKLRIKRKADVMEEEEEDEDAVLAAQDALKADTNAKSSRGPQKREKKSDRKSVDTKAENGQPTKKKARKSVGGDK